MQFGLYLQDLPSRHRPWLLSGTVGDRQLMGSCAGGPNGGSAAVRRFGRRALLSAALIALCALAAGAAAGLQGGMTGPLRADVDLNDVSVEHALRFLAELYDVSIATGQLPDTRVTVRLRGVTAEDAFRSVAVAAGLEVERHGAVVLVAPRTQESEVRQIVLGPFPPALGADPDWLAAADVEVRRIGSDAIMLEGPADAVQAIAEALRDARRGSVGDRVFPLGVAPGEETLQAVRPLLDADLESATYDATGHLMTVSALPATLDRVETLLAELTRSPAQFEIEVRVVEVSRNALKRMGAQGFFRLEARGGVLSTTFPLTGLDDAARYFPSPNDLAALAGLGGASNATSDSGSFQDAGFRFGRVDGRGIGLLIEFLEQSGEARVMATPKVTALDNRTARISMVTTLRIPTFTQNQAFSTTSVTGIEEVDVGTTLEVRPRRAAGGEILLTVTPEVSELAPTVQTFDFSGLTQSLPVVTRRRTETEVILGAGETLVIGGLVSEREAETLGKTPGLGAIPGLGRAFRHKGKDSVSSELLVFVTPHQLPPPEQRRAKARVDDQWIPAGLAARINAARSLTGAAAATQRMAGVRTLERLDGDLLAAGLDAGHDVVSLGADPDLGVRVAAALFLIRRRPVTAFGELVRFADSRAVALSALGAPMAPHQRAALAELVVRSDGGTELLAGRLRSALDSGDAVTAPHLLEALCAAAPERAANLAAELAGVAGDHGVVPATLRLDALSGAPGAQAELARRAANAESEEVRAFAVAALVRSLGPVGTAELLRGRAPAPAGSSLARQIRALEPFATSPPATEPALAWSGSPGEIEIRGDRAGGERVREALELLARRAPDLRHLVGFALATIEIGAAASAVDPADRSARIASDGLAPERLAHRLVRLATIVFESRVRGFPATGGRSLARAVREEIRALERLTGAPCPPERAESTVRQVLRAATRKGAGDA